MSTAHWCWFEKTNPDFFKRNCEISRELRGFSSIGSRWPLASSDLAFAEKQKIMVANEHDGSAWVPGNLAGRRIWIFYARALSSLYFHSRLSGVICFLSHGWSFSIWGYVMFTFRSALCLFFMAEVSQRELIVDVCILVHTWVWFHVYFFSMVEIFHFKDAGCFSFCSWLSEAQCFCTVEAVSSWVPGLLKPVEASHVRQNQPPSTHSPWPHWIFQPPVSYSPSEAWRHFKIMGPGRPSALPSPSQPDNETFIWPCNWGRWQAESSLATCCARSGC